MFSAIQRDMPGQTALRARISAEKLSTATSVPTTSSGTQIAPDRWSMFSASQGVNSRASCAQASLKGKIGQAVELYVTHASP